MNRRDEPWKDSAAKPPVGLKNLVLYQYKPVKLTWWGLKNELTNAVWADGFASKKEAERYAAQRGMTVVGQEKSIG